MNELKKTNDTKIIKLVAALFIDGMGLLSYLIPGIGEMFDAVWAPISAILVYYMFGRKLSWAGFFFPLGSAIHERAFLVFPWRFPIARGFRDQEYHKYQKA